MHFSTVLTTTLAALAQLSAAAPNPSTGWKPNYCVKETPAVDSTTIPRKFGVLMFQGFDGMDVFGTLNSLFTVSWAYQIELVFISETMDPVSNRPLMASMNKMNSSIFSQVVPTHTLETAPKDLEVLLVPGGAGARSPYLGAYTDFIAERMPSLKYLMTVCTGAILASNAGVLDGKRATTNKKAWDTVTASNGTVDWISHARWVVDGNVWTTSGVSSGVDGMLAFIECMYGPETAELDANNMEWRRVKRPANDPFADLYGLEDVDNTED